MTRTQFCIYLFGILVYAELHDWTGYVNLQINFEKDVNKIHFTLNCSSMFPPFGGSVEFLINDITTANIRSSNGVCHISRRICKEGECSCTSQIYVWSFWSTTAERNLVFTCQFRFEQENQKSHLLVYETKIYNGSDIFEEKTNFQQIAISRSDSTLNNNTTPAIGSGDFSIVYISILICIPVAMAIIALSILCLKCFNKRKMDAIDDGKHLSPEETSLIEGLLQTRQTELCTKINETGTEEKTIMCHSISKERKMDEIDDGKPITPEETSILEGHMQTRQIDYLYTKLNETGPEEKVMQCHRISEERKVDEIDDEKPLSPEERKMNEIDDGKLLSHEESSGGHFQMNQTHSQPALNEQEIHTKSVRDQIIAGKLANSLNSKESFSIEGYLQTRHTYSDSTLDNMRNTTTL